MLYILKKYLKGKAEKDYSIFSIRNLISCICMGALFCINGTKGQLPQANFAVTIGLSVVLMIFSCECITNKFYINANKEIPKGRSFYKKIIASNIAVVLNNIFCFIIVFSVIDIYFLGFNGLNLIAQTIILMILSLGVGNFIFIFRGNFSSKTSKDVMSAIIAMVLGLGSNYLYYKVGGIVLFPVTLVIYGLSVIVNENIYLHQNSINS